MKDDMVSCLSHHSSEEEDACTMQGQLSFVPCPQHVVLASHEHVSLSGVVGRSHVVPQQWTSLAQALSVPCTLCT